MEYTQAQENFIGNVISEIVKSAREARAYGYNPTVEDLNEIVKIATKYLKNKSHSFYYLIQVREPTNNPGSWLTQHIAFDEDQAREWVDNFLEGDWTDVEEVEDCEWDDQGPNWKNIITYRVDDTIITIDEIDNKVD